MVLQNIKETLDKYVEVLHQVIKVNVEIIDADFKVVACSDEHTSSEHYNSYVYQQVIATKEKIVVMEPGVDAVCSQCEKKNECEDLLEVHTPILLGEQALGVICFSCTEIFQKEYILDNFDPIMEFINQISDLISLKAKEFLESEQVNSFLAILGRVINHMEQGVLVLSVDNTITMINEAAIKILNLQDSEGGSGVPFEGNGVDAQAGNATVGSKGEHLPIRVELLQGMNQGEYLLRIKGSAESRGKDKDKDRDREYALIGEAINLNIVDSKHHTLLTFTGLEDYHTKIAAFTVTNENVGMKDILGSSPEIVALKQQILKIADSTTTVLITGASGTGKELFARAIHVNGNRRKAPFITINCAAIPDTLLESELFGYAKGAFTGADPRGKVGKIELANHGILFLDEVGDMPLYLQAKLLRVLQDREVVRLGSNKSTKTDVRFIAATNKNLQEMIEEKKFREDLYYRLNVIPIHIPDLRERREDILMLAEYFVKKYGDLFQKEVHGIDKEVLSLFAAYDWPGNVRELENTIEYMINMMDCDGRLTVGLLSGPILARGKESLKSLGVENARDLHEGETFGRSSLSEGTLEGPLGGCSSIPELEKEMLRQALAVCGQDGKSMEELARQLGISRATLYRKKKKYDL